MKTMSTICTQRQISIAIENGILKQKLKTKYVKKNGIMVSRIRLESPREVASTRSSIDFRKSWIRCFFF